MVQEPRKFRAEHERRSVSVLACIIILLFVGLLIGCYSPLQGDLNNDNSITLDLSWYVGALDQPSQEGWVFDVFLFRPENVSNVEGQFQVTSRKDAIRINGNEFHRIALGQLSGGWYLTPDDGAFYIDNGIAQVNGIPAGGPYVMLVLVWEVWSGTASMMDAWVTHNGSQFVPFNIKAGETTKLNGSDIQSGIYGSFTDTEEYFGAG